VGCAEGLRAGSGRVGAVSGGVSSSVRAVPRAAVVDRSPGRSVRRASAVASSALLLGEGGVGRGASWGEGQRLGGEVQVLEEVSPVPRCISAADPRLPVAALEGDPPRERLGATAAEANDQAVGEKRDELARSAAPGAGERIDGEDTLQELGPRQAGDGGMGRSAGGGCSAGHEEVTPRRGGSEDAVVGDDQPGEYDQVKFDFLGYTFQPRRAKNRWGKHFIGFLPAISAKAAKAIRATIREWRMASTRNNQRLEDLTRLVNPVVRGWMNYYGRYYRSKWVQVLRHLNEALAAWARRKYKRLRRRERASVHWLGRIARREPNLFVLWQLGVRPEAGG